jgi:hypothetical protein
VPSNVVGSWWLFNLDRAYFALDTETGQMCRTWEFNFDKPTPVQQTALSIPTCKSLYLASR